MDDTENQPPHTCPECLHTDQLKVRVLTWAKLTPQGPEFEDDEEHTINDDDGVQCDQCGWEGTLNETRPDDASGE